MKAPACTVAVLLTVAAVGCAHVKDAQVIAVAERPSTIASIDTIDTARLRSDETTRPETAARELAELIAAHMAVVGIVRAPVSSADITVELPAPGWILRARLAMRPELFCMLTLEPLATQPTERAVEAAPWSVLDAFDRVHRGVISLLPPREPPIPLARFSRLRQEATVAAQANRDPPLTQVEYRRTARPISEAPERPYYTPTSDAAGASERP
jgi:hypothetical protein